MKQYNRVMAVSRREYVKRSVEDPDVTVSVDSAIGRKKLANELDFQNNKFYFAFKTFTRDEIDAEEHTKIANYSSFKAGIIDENGNFVEENREQYLEGAGLVKSDNELFNNLINYAKWFKSGDEDKPTYHYIFDLEETRRAGQISVLFSYKTFTNLVFEMYRIAREKFAEKWSKYTVLAKLRMYSPVESDVKRLFHYISQHVESEKKLIDFILESDRVIGDDYDISLPNLKYAGFTDFDSFKKLYEEDAEYHDYIINKFNDSEAIGNRIFRENYDAGVDYVDYRLPWLPPNVTKKMMIFADIDEDDPNTLEQLREMIRDEFKEEGNTGPLLSIIKKAENMVSYDTKVNGERESVRYARMKKQYLNDILKAHPAEQYINKNPDILYDLYRFNNAVELSLGGGQQFGSEGPEGGAALLDMDYFEIVMFPDYSVYKAGSYDYNDPEAIYKGFYNGKTGKIMSKKLHDHIYIGRNKVKIIDPCLCYKQKSLKYINCFLACINHITADKDAFAELEDKISSKVKIDPKSKETYKIDVTRNLLNECANISGYNLELYELTEEMPLCMRSTTEFDETVMLGIKNEHIVIIDHCDVTDITAMSSESTNTDNYCMAFYDIESVQDLKTNAQIPFMVAYKLCTLNKNDYQKYTVDKDFSDCIEKTPEKVLMGIMEQTTTHIFTGIDCIKQMLNQIQKDSEHLNKVINVYGFNSCGYDNFFVASEVASRAELKPKLNVLKTKLYVSTKYAHFKDIAPLLRPGSLATLCASFKIILAKKKGDVSFNYLNFTYNIKADRDLNKFIEILKSTKTSNKDLDGLSIYDAVERYNKFDIYATEELAIWLRLNFEYLFKEVLKRANKPDLMINILQFDTLGQASMALFCKLNETKSTDSDKLGRKQKKTEYQYQAIFDGHIMAQYDKWHDPFASISYNKTNFNSLKLAEKTTYDAGDIVSLYPTIMNSHHEFGYGRLTKHNLQSYPLDLSNPRSWPYGKFLVYLEPRPERANRMKRIPYKPSAIKEPTGNFDDQGRPIIKSSTNSDIWSYTWIHDKPIYRVLNKQDIVHSVEAGDYYVKYVEDFVIFDKVARFKDAFGSYIEPFMEIKNHMDAVKGTDEYNNGYREATKDMMNILSGKAIQCYDYKDSIKIEHDDSVRKKFACEEIINTKSSKDKCKLKHTERELMTTKTFDVYSLKLGPFHAYRSKNVTAQQQMLFSDDDTRSNTLFFDYSLVMDQIYCYSREHMFKYLVDPCFDAGYEPYIIETDSMTTDSRFYNNLKAQNPTINTNGIDIPMFCGRQKIFGQVDLEITDIDVLLTYMKKSYYLEYVENGCRCHKFRFKGVSKIGSLLVTDPAEIDIFRQYTTIETLSAWFTDDQMATLRNRIMNYFYKNLGEDTFLNSQLAQRRIFENLTAGLPALVLRPQLKKNIVADRRDNLVNVTGFIAIKAFNHKMSADAHVTKYNCQRVYDELMDYFNIDEATLHEQEPEYNMKPHDNIVTIFTKCLDVIKK